MSFSARLEKLRTPYVMLILMAITIQVGFASWSAILNNFAHDRASFTGADMGLLQSVREIPGFLAFAAVFFLLLFKEQTFALLSLLVFSIGVLITGFFPTLTGLLITTFIMSVGFHYYETMSQSLQLQWLPKETAPKQLGTILAAASFGQLLIFGLVILLWKVWALPYVVLFAVFGTLALGLTLFMVFFFPQFKQPVVQNKKLILRKRYWLYYALTFMSGARRQIFVVFAAWMMVEKFGYDVHEVALLFIINVTFNMLFARRIGAAIGHFGERAALTFEYIGLILVFVSYAFVNNAFLGATLYVVDHFFFALAIAMKTYFQKIADPADMAPTAAVAFTINHIAAVFIPVLFGLLWLHNPSYVFLAGAGFAFISLLLSQLIPRHPVEGHETLLVKPQPVAGE
jgi:MFS family permease